MKSLILAALLFANSAFAAQFYEINLDWSAEGLPKTHAKILTKAGEAATVKSKNNNEEFILEVNPQPSEDKKGVWMKFNVSKINATGEKTSLGTPQIRALLGETAAISVGEKDKAEILSISATVKPSNGKPEYFKR